MRRLLHICTSLTLLLCGQSTALSAMLFCPHAASMRTVAASTAQHVEHAAVAQAHEEQRDKTHDCCLQEKSRDDSGASHCPMSKGSKNEPEHPPTQTVPATDADRHAQQEREPTAKEPEATPSALDNAQTFGQPSTSCSHCLRRPGQPPASFLTRELGRDRRDAGSLAPTETRPLSPPAFSFAPRIIPSQGAPSGQRTRLHILNSILLI